MAKRGLQGFFMGQLTTRILGLILISMLVSCSASSRGGTGSSEDGYLSDADLSLSESARWGDGNIPQASAGGPFRDVLFEYDSSIIAAEYRENLKSDAQILISDPSLHAEVEGHCDKRGTNEYNIALGEERAKSVANYLVSLGVAPSSLSTISYGEEIPIDPGNSEAAFSRNRRVHFAVYRSKEGRR